MKQPIDGNIGMDLTYCSKCGLESEDCRCTGDLVDEELGGDDGDESL